MAGRDGRTEAPTQKRKRDARRDGRIARSREVLTSAQFLVTVGVFGAALPRALEVTSEQMQVSLAGVGGGNLAAWTTGLVPLALAWFPPVAAVSSAGLVAQIAQGGVQLGSKAAKPSLRHLSPARGLRNLFGKEALLQLGRAAIKLAIVAAVLVPALQHLVEQVPTRTDLADTTGLIGRTLSAAAWKLAVAMAVFAAADYALARRKLHHDLMMTRQEVVDEMKSSEGDPHLKAARRRRGLEAARRRGLGDVSVADVIVTNPTHFAVALRYKPGAPAPQVIAKGINRAALKIRREAVRQGVPVIENRPLARALYRQCKLGAYVPERLFDDVIKVLVAAYWRRGRIPAVMAGAA